MVNKRGLRETPCGIDQRRHSHQSLTRWSKSTLVNPFCWPNKLIAEHIRRKSSSSFPSRCATACWEGMSLSFVARRWSRKHEHFEELSRRLQRVRTQGYTDWSFPARLDQTSDNGPRRVVASGILTRLSAAYRLVDTVGHKNVPPYFGL